ncbi:MAG: dephospho-CoA kinase [Candidatus Hydrogenedentota bacterium]
MKIIGLTGGIGSGKSEAARRFDAYGIPVIDADAIGHALLRPGSPVESELLRIFGVDIIVNGAIDRGKIAEIVFRDANVRADLNRLVHPLIVSEVARRCTELSDQGKPRAIVEAALLGEAGVREPYLDGLILVLAPEPVRVSRLVERRGMTAKDARLRVAAQQPPENKLAIADWVIHNDADLPHLHRQVDTIIREWANV